MRVQRHMWDGFDVSKWARNVFFTDSTRGAGGLAGRSLLGMG